MNHELTNAGKFKNDLKIASNVFKNTFIYALLVGGLMGLITGDVNTGYYIGGGIGGLLVTLYQYES